MTNKGWKRLSNLALAAVVVCSALTAAVPTAMAYGGQEPGAAWRTEAASRIEQYRKGTMIVTVKNASGQNVSGANVSVRMKKHLYKFGSAFASDWIDSTSSTAVTYRQKFLENFNYATIENGMKWDFWDNEIPGFSREQTVRAAKWLRDNGIRQRGHTLIWNAKGSMNLGGMTVDQTDAAVRSFVNSQMNYADSTIALKDAITDWDVLNEATHNSNLFKKLGQTRIKDIFGLARWNDPDGNLFINDAKIIGNRNAIEWGPDDAQHNGEWRENYYYDLIRYLVDNGSTLSGIGFQNHHVGWDLTSMDQVKATLDRFSAFGKRIQATEYDVYADTSNSNREALEGQYMRDFMTMWFSHPSTDAFIVWGFYDGKHWHNNSPLYRSDWTLKPSGVAYRDLVFNQWWTNADGTTNASGNYQTRGFLGDYEITVSHGGRTKKVQQSLTSTGTTTVTVVLDDTPSVVWSACAYEGGQCSFSGTKSVRYGANGSYHTGTFHNGTACTNAVFGDPAIGQGKSCETSSATVAWTECAAENGHCAVTGNQVVRYGANGLYHYKNVNNATVACNNATFGDPVPGVAKACQRSNP